MIDTHCHILPGIDDGPTTLSESLALAQRQVEMGIDTVVATPHVNWNTPNDPDVISQLTVELAAALREQGVPLRVLAGAEVALSRALEMDHETLARHRLARGSWLLVEPPLSVTCSQVEEGLVALIERGHKLVIAHPERCAAFQQDPGLMRRIVRRGAVGQLTAASLTGSYGGTVKSCALDLLRRGDVHVVASDAHDTRRRAPGMREQLDATGFTEIADWMTQAVPLAIIAGASPPPAPSGVPVARAPTRWRPRLALSRARRAARS